MYVYITKNCNLCNVLIAKRMILKFGCPSEIPYQTILKIKIKKTIFDQNRDHASLKLTKITDFIKFYSWDDHNSTLKQSKPGVFQAQISHDFTNSYTIR